MTSLSAAIREVLLTGETRGKIMATRALARAWRRGALAWDFTAEMPERPAWPANLELLPPNRMPKRGRGGSLRAAIALWHSLAHIEFIAIDLALDMAGRFGARMGEEFVDDFLAVAADEALHFALIQRKLRSLGAAYGALPAHDGLWEAAHETRHDVAARLAVVPMVLEARGLDVTPTMRERVLALGDESGARILQRILDDEIRHVAAGTKHFAALCRSEGKVPQDHWKMLLQMHFRGGLKPPFNDSARLTAGLSRDFYATIA
ncbi:MAG TPA: ferritin-like domain-containing protein [Croceibacterium sp.]